MDSVPPTASQINPPSGSPSGHYPPGHRLHHFTIRQLLGEGGFGVVYQAEQSEPVRRMTALKVIKPGMDSHAVVARFEAERQALAVMDHPCVAKVYDGGLTPEGRPYFAMELIKGLPITEHCDRHSLSLNQRLELFIRVCEAVQHAHNKGVVHRDLKPSNILVEYEDSRSTPKIIDFGIAKALNQRLTEATIFTEHGQLIGTPEYMSPEQAEMSGQDIDTRSDVYSLGVILYELLTGSRPFESETLRKAGMAEIQRIIREVEPPKPSTRVASMALHGGDRSTSTRIAQARRTELRFLQGILRRDLDWVAMKCLEKNRERRYDTANALAMELRRYLKSEPVLAGPPSAGYKLRKFVKRNKGQVAAGGVIAGLLVLGVVGTSYGMMWALSEKSLASAAADSERIAKVEAQANEQRAIDEAKRAEAAEADALARAEELGLVVAFQSSQLSAIEPEIMGANLRRSLLDAAGEAQSGALAAALSSVNFTTLALTTLKDNIFQRTIGAIDAQFESQPLVRTRLLQTVADTLRGVGLLDLAIDTQERALAIRRRELGDAHPLTLECINGMGVKLQDLGRLDKAEPYYREALEGYRRSLGDDHANTQACVNNLGTLLLEQGRFNEAEPYFRESMESRRRLFGDDHTDTLVSVTNMGSLLRAQGRLDEAQRHWSEALEGYRRTLGDSDPRTLITINNMGGLHWSRGQLDEAEPYWREALEGRRRVLGDNHPETLTSINNMGSLLQTQGRFAEAEPYSREAWEKSRSVQGEQHPLTLLFASNLGRVLQMQGKHQEAIDLLAPVEAAARQAFTRGNAHRLARLLDTLGRARAGLGYDGERFALAEKNFLEARPIYAAARGESHEDTLGCVQGLVELYTEWSRAEPGKGHDVMAAEWKTKIDAARPDRAAPDAKR